MLIDSIDPAGLVALMKMDKKRRQGSMSFVVPRGLGSAELCTKVSSKAIVDSLKEVLS